MDSLHPQLSFVDEHTRPPLAKDLFNERPDFGAVIDALPACQSIVGRLRAVFLRNPNANLEEELENLQSRAESYPQLRKDLVSLRFYLQRTIWGCTERWSAQAHGITMYGQLLSQLAEWSANSGEELCFVTFNYDTLLEEACRTSFGLRLETVDSLITESTEVRILKLHGSVNWGRAIDGFTSMQTIAPPPGWPRDGASEATWNLIDRIDDLRVTSAFRLLVAPTDLWDGNGRLAIPAIAIPVLKKKSFDECPQRHLDVLDSCIRETTRLLLVGWHATEYHFLDRWRTRNPFFPMEIVAGNYEAAEIVQANAATGGLESDAPHLSTKGFHDYAVSGDIEWLLDAKTPPRARSVEE